MILGQTISQRSERSMSLFHFLPDNFAQLDPLNAPVKFTKLFIEGRERGGEGWKVVHTYFKVEVNSLMY